VGFLGEADDASSRPETKESIVVCLRLKTRWRSSHCARSTRQEVEVRCYVIFANLVNVMREYGFAGGQINLGRGKDLENRSMPEVVNLTQSQG
jgi:hypothetical protein